LGKVGRRCRSVGVVCVPGLEKLHDLATMRIVGFYCVDPFHRVAATQR
jgi:hypothetical protein